MKITKIKALITLSTLLPLTLSPAVVAATPRPVIGYTQTGSQWNLTLNGSPRFSLSAPAQLAPQMNQQFAQMSRTLNQLLERTPLEKIDIRPVVDGQQFRIQAQQRPLLQINAQLASGHQKGQLDFLLDTTNKLRRSFGNKPLRTFDRLQAHHLKGTIGYASWYGGHFHGRRTANGERYDIHKLTAAHPRLPFGTKVLVTSLDTKQSVIVKINDRGPFVGHRLIDLSPAAFDAIGALGQGVMKVHLKILG